jgi:tetratricopeptide (TPR) repeat protein
MKRLILTGILVLATGFSGLMAQKQQKKKGDDKQEQVTGPQAKSKAEGLAVQALGQAQDPDSIIKAAEELVTKFADTQFKEIAILMEARAYQQKGDPAKAQIYAERALETNPNSYQANMLLGNVLAAHTGEHDFDRDEKLAKAEKCLNSSIAEINTAAKPSSQVSDQDWDATKKQMIAEAHNGLGLVALDKKNYENAVKEFQTAADMDPQPAYLVRLASSQSSAGKYDEAMAVCDKIMADQQAPQQVRQLAQAVRAAAAKNKAAKQ